MTLRNLINRLEQISRGGKNDDFDVIAWGDDGMIDMDVVDVSVDRFVGSVEEFEYVKIHVQ